MSLDQQEANWVEDLVRWLLGLPNPRTNRLHHRREALHAAYYLIERARKAKPQGLQPREVSKLWIACPPSPASRAESSGSRILHASEAAISRLFSL